METPPDHIGINKTPHGQLYGYEHAERSVSRSIPDYPDSADVEAEFYLVSVLIHYKHVPDHRNVHIVPPSRIDEFTSQAVREHGNSIESIELVSEADALDRLRDFANHDADSLRELAKNTTYVDPANAASST